MHKDTFYALFLDMLLTLYYWPQGGKHGGVQTCQKLHTIHSNDVVTSDRILFPENYSNGDSMFSCNDCTSLPDYTASQTRTHRHRSPAAPPYQTQHIPLLSRKTHAEHDHKTMTFHVTVSEDEHLGLV